MAYSSQAVWKYRTPLQSDFLAVTQSHLTTPGITYFKDITVPCTVSGNDVILTLPEFSVFIHSNKTVSTVSENSEETLFKLKVKKHQSILSTVHQVLVTE